MDQMDHTDQLIILIQDQDHTDHKDQIMEDRHHLTQGSHLKTMKMMFRLLMDLLTMITHLNHHSRLKRLKWIRFSIKKLSQFTSKKSNTYKNNNFKINFKIYILS